MVAKSIATIYTNIHKPTDYNGLEAEATKLKRTISRKVARTLVPKKDVKSAKRQTNTEEETCQRLVYDEPFGNSRRDCGNRRRNMPALHKRGSML